MAESRYVMSKGLSTRRKVLGLSQAELAARAGVSQSLVSDVERGNRVTPELSEKVKLALLAAEKEIDQNSSDSDESAARPASPSESSGQLNESSVHSVEMFGNSNEPTGRLTLITPARGTPAQGVPAEVERALSLAFDGKRHLLTDGLSVLRIAARLPLAGREPRELVEVFRGYLDAAARLRGRSVDITTENLFAEMTFSQK